MIEVNRFKEHVYDVIGAIYEVHNELGPGLNEACYQEGLEYELRGRGIEAEREWTFHPFYHGAPMESTYRLDFLCKGDIIVECKSVEQLTQTHRAQHFNYMRLLKKPCGILVNFATQLAKVERYFYDIEQRCILTVDGEKLNRDR